MDKVLTSNVIRRCACRLYRWIEGARGDAFRWDIARSPKVAVSIPMVSLISSSDLILRPHYGPGVDSASNRNEYQEYILGDKDGRCVRLTTLPPSCANYLYIRQPQPLGNLRACTGIALPFLSDLKWLWIIFLWFPKFERENDCKIVCLGVNMKYVRTLLNVDRQCWSVCYVIRNYRVNGVSLDCQFLKLGFIQQGWIFLAVCTECLDVTYGRKRYWTLSRRETGFSNIAFRESFESQKQRGELTK
jgi:hypothetical protein